MITTVLLPGLLCDARLWAHQVENLESSILIPDLTRHSTIEGLAASVLEEAPRHFALAGLSMGGYVALEILNQEGDRVKKLALLSTSARADSEEQKRVRAGLIDLTKTGKFRGVTPRLFPTLVHESNVGDDAIRETVFSMAETVGPQGFTHQATAVMNRKDHRALLPHIDCPTMIIVGREDQRTPLPLSEEMAATIPGAKLHILERCGHLPPLEQPEKTTALLNAWLSE